MSYLEYMSKEQSLLEMLVEEEKLVREYNAQLEYASMCEDMRKKCTDEYKEEFIIKCDLANNSLREKEEKLYNHRKSMYETIFMFLHNRNGANDGN